MATAKSLPTDLAVQMLDALLQLHRERNTDAIHSMLSGLDECPDAMAGIFVSGLVTIARS